MWVIIPSLFASPGSQSRKEKHLQVCLCVFVNLFVCVYVANTEVAVVFMPAIRMLSLPTAPFHLAQLCVRICECVCVCV